MKHNKQIQHDYHIIRSCVAQPKYGLHLYDARNLLKFFSNGCHTGQPNQTVDLTITSPPYYNLKNYGSDGQIGYGQGYHMYLKQLGEIFSALYKLTRSTGSLWVIVDLFRDNGAVINLPFDVTRTIEDAGWKLRDIIIWEKDKTLPWSRKGQLRKLHEYVIFFSKTNDFKYRIDRIRLLDDLKEWWVKYPERYHPMGKVPSNVWYFPIPVQGSWGHRYLRHFCPFPVGLVERIIQLCTDPRDLVFDPFAGSGVVVATAEALGRKAVGFELNKKYVEHFATKGAEEIRSGALQFLKMQKTKEEKQRELRQIIEKLRQVKYPKTLVRRLESKTHVDLQKMGLNTIFVVAKPKTKTVFDINNLKLLNIDCYVVFNRKVKSKNIMDKICKVASNPPLSKFGINPKFFIIERKDAMKRLKGNGRFFLYTKGATYYYDRPMLLEDWWEESSSADWKKLFFNGLPPIMSSVAIRQEIHHTYKLVRRNVKDASPPRQLVKFVKTT